MPRLSAVMIAAVLAFGPRATVIPFDGSAAAADNAWLVVVDDLHINFGDTGRLRTLLRAVASELIQDGDLFELRTTGPSPAMPLTADSDLLAAAIKAATGNALKPSDFIGMGSGRPASSEVLYRANTALDTVHDALVAFAAGDGNRKAIIYVSAGYDIDAFPAVADRMSAFARRAREDAVTIFAIDARGLETPLHPTVDPNAWQRYTTATRRSLTIIAEQTGGFVIEKSHEPAAGLKRINLQMR